ncbi:hypothetical protein [Fluviicola sp.]
MLINRTSRFFGATNSDDYLMVEKGSVQLYVIQFMELNASLDFVEM